MIGKKIIWILSFGLCLSNLGSLAQSKKPYIVLVSIDGFRYDYTKLFSAPEIARIQQEGASVKSLISCFPSKTFPNHYSLITGMYSENHGIIDNAFYSPFRKQNYTKRNPSITADSSWYAGTPFWNLCEKNNLKTACFFWVGSEAAIQGIRPSLYKIYDESIPQMTRVNQVIDWLKMPEDERPHFITLYFSDVDEKGHDYGAESEEVQRAITGVDTCIAHLNARIAELGLPVNVIIVSDHGMVTYNDLAHTVFYEDILLKSGVEYESAYNGVTLMHLHLKRKKDLAKAYKKLNAIKDNRFKVYKRNQIPAQWHYENHESIGDLLLVTEQPYVFRSNTQQYNSTQKLGMHGYDPALPEMQSILYAIGSSFEPNKQIGSVENIHLYPLLCAILGLTPPNNIDGRLEALEDLLKK